MEEVPLEAEVLLLAWLAFEGEPLDEEREEEVSAGIVVAGVRVDLTVDE